MLRLISASPPRRRSMVSALRRRIDAHIRRQGLPPLQVAWCQDLNAQTRWRLLDVVRLFYQHNPGRDVRLDLSRCQVLSDDGLEALVWLANEAQAAGGRLHVYAPCGQPARKIATARLGTLLRCG